MKSTRLNGLHSLSLTGYLFGYGVRQIDHATTFFYLKSLSRDDKLWLIYRYEHCPVRLGMNAPESQHRPGGEISYGFGKQVILSA
jgi:hypothetical protein